MNCRRSTQSTNTLRAGLVLLFAVAHGSRGVRGSRNGGQDPDEAHSMQPHFGQAVFNLMHNHHRWHSGAWLEVQHEQVVNNASVEGPVEVKEYGGKEQLREAMKNMAKEKDSRKGSGKAPSGKHATQVRELAFPDAPGGAGAPDGWEVGAMHQDTMYGKYIDARGPYVRAIAAKADEPQKNRTLYGMLKDMMMNLGGGTGATVGGTGDVSLDQDLLRRMRFQDKAVMLLLLIAYSGSLAFSASLVYRQSSNDSPVTYYADPRFHNMAIDNDEAESFLDAFNQPPKDVQLQVSGLVPLPPLPESFVDAAVEWLGSRYRVQFSFALDLSPWVVRSEEHTDPADVADGTARSEATVGVPAEDVTILSDFLSHNRNDLAVVEVVKKVDWRDWEELAMNIKHQIRQTGFAGVISVTRSGEEIVSVHKNRPWANFMHSRTTKVLCALSIVGWLVYQPYMLLRHTATTIRAHYKVDCDIAAYWPLIYDKMGPDGFDTNGGGSVTAS